jgi:hypothetical protein
MKKKTKAEKKQWQKPELIVLSRNKPEEMVLTACKVTADPPAPGPSNGSYQCNSESLPACFDTGRS